MNRLRRLPTKSPTGRCVGQNAAPGAAESRTVKRLGPAAVQIGRQWPVCPAVLLLPMGPGWQRKSFFWPKCCGNHWRVCGQKKIAAYSPMQSLGFALLPMAPNCIFTGLTATGRQYLPGSSFLRSSRRRLPGLRLAPFFWTRDA